MRLSPGPHRTVKAGPAIRGIGSQSGRIPMFMTCSRLSTSASTVGENSIKASRFPITHRLSFAENDDNTVTDNAQLSVMVKKLSFFVSRTLCYDFLMCYSAMVKQYLKKLGLEYNARVQHDLFEELY